VDVVVVKVIGNISVIAGGHRAARNSVTPDNIVRDIRAGSVLLYPHGNATAGGRGRVIGNGIVKHAELSVGQGNKHAAAGLPSCVAINYIVYKLILSDISNCA